MKSSLALIAILAFTFASSAQQPRQRGVQLVQPTATKASAANPLVNFYGKELHFAMHKRNNVKVEHDLVDYLLFDEDGTFTDSKKGDIGGGTWTYEESSRQLTLSYDGSTTVVVFTIKEIQDTKLKLATETDTMTLYVPKARKDSTLPTQVRPIED
jgi:hypothetical protein